MADYQVSDGGMFFQTWRVAVNILIKQLLTAKGGGSPALDWVRGLTTPTIKTVMFYKMFYRASNLDGFFGMT
jgi:hypothetical protein